MRKLQICVWFLILITSVAACQTDSDQATPTEKSPEGASSVVAPVSQNDAYPAQPSPTPLPPEDPYPGETSSFPSTLAQTGGDFSVPEPSADSGIVTGRLLTPDVDGEPYLATLYLGDTIYADGQVDSFPVVSFSEQDSPLAIQDPQTGIFYFSDVLPGEYALIIWTPAFSMIVRDPETQQDMIFDVRANETTDLEVIGIP